MSAVINMRMLGTFEIEYQQHILNYDDIHSPMAVKLLSLLILHRHEHLDKWTLAANLFGGSKSSQANSIKSLIWRTEKLIEELFSNTHFICHEADCYYLNPSIEINADYEQLFSLHKQMQTSLKKEILAKEIIMLYQGSFLPMLECDHVTIEINHRILKAVIDAVYVLIQYHESHLHKISSIIEHIIEHDQDQVIQNTVLHKLGQQHHYHLQNKVLSLFNRNNEDLALETTPYYFARLCQLIHRKRYRPREQYVLCVQYQQNHYSNAQLKERLLHIIQNDAYITQFRNNEFYILFSSQFVGMINIINKLAELAEGFSCEYHAINEIAYSEEIDSL